MKLDKKDLLLYAVTDRSWLDGRTLYEQVQQALQGGVTMLQLREKNRSGQELFHEAMQIKKLCARYEVPFIINDNVFLAQETDADGVHLGQNDMDAGSARARLGPGKIIGDGKNRAAGAGCPGSGRGLYRYRGCLCDRDQAGCAGHRPEAAERYL